MAKKRPARPETQSELRHDSNADLVEAAESVLPDILRYYQQFQDKRPIMLLDIQSERIHALPYEEFKADLSEPSQATLTASYEKAVVENKVVVFVRDNESRRLVSVLFRNE